MIAQIKQIQAREILDSRGIPTIEAEVHCTDGAWGRAAVPSGASKGALEAHELRDGEAKRYHGQGVRQAIRNIEEELGPALLGMPVLEQKECDRRMIHMDGTENKAVMGANAILGLSLALAQAAAQSQGLALYEYLAQISNTKKLEMPVPFMNLINGGSHANNNLDFQEFMIVPHGFESFHEALRAGAETFFQLRKLLIEEGHSITVGDEGGFAPNLYSHESALDWLLKAIEKAGYQPKEEISLALDVAASVFYDSQKNIYKITTRPKEQSITTEELSAYYHKLSLDYPLLSIEDPLNEAKENWGDWLSLSEKIGDRVQIVGDDLFVSNPTIFKEILNYTRKQPQRNSEKAKNLKNTSQSPKEHQRPIAQCVLTKMNQIGTVSESIELLSLAKKSNINSIISHRSGETEDISIAHLAVGTNARQIKTGSLSRSERTAKYNELLRIEEQLQKKGSVEYAGSKVFAKYL